MAEGGALLYQIGPSSYDTVVVFVVVHACETESENTAGKKAFYNFMFVGTLYCTAIERLQAPLPLAGARIGAAAATEYCKRMAGRSADDGGMRLPYLRYLSPCALEVKLKR